MISWNFGDGTTEVQPDQARFNHTFPGPGVYEVTASVTDNLGNTYSWTQRCGSTRRLPRLWSRLPGPGNRVILTA